MAKDINMQETTIELKRVAKAVGAHLNRHGHKVPHTLVLDAIASALNKRDWQTFLGTAANATAPAPEPKAAAATLPELATRGESIEATFRTDDRRCKVEFDARAYFATATAKNIEDLLKCAFECDYPADEVAESTIPFDENLKDGFAYLTALQRASDTETVGFEVYVSATAALAWLAAYRCPTLALALCAFNEAPAASEEQALELATAQGYLFKALELFKD